jgi:hypothetical protein
MDGPADPPLDYIGFGTPRKAAEPETPSLQWLWSEAVKEWKYP